VGADSRFSEQDQRVAETLAARAAAAVDLHQRLSRETVRSMLRAQERERKRIARELHDETGQALTSILLALKPLEAEVGTASIAPVHELVAEALADVRRLAVELRPAILDDFGLVPALERLVRGLREKREIDVQLHSSITDERLPDELETALYRIAQEALTNVVKHARAGRAHIRLWQDDGSVRLVIEDDGDGFSAAEAPPERLGLTGIRERVELLAGRLTIESEPGEGACLVAELPLEGAYQAVGHPRVETQSPPPGTST
jgi:signal transduction histidine kinase